MPGAVVRVFDAEGLHLKANKPRESLRVLKVPKSEAEMIVEHWRATCLRPIHTCGSGSRILNASVPLCTKTATQPCLHWLLCDPPARVTHSEGSGSAGPPR